MSKTLLVGLDAVCWDYLNPLLHAGDLPVFQEIMRAGVWGTLWSTMPPWTPTAWSSIITGKNPGKHGVYDMLWRRPGTYEFTPTNASVRRGTTFWKRLNDVGLRVGLVNIPFTFPPQPLDGFLVCGFGTPQTAAALAYPAAADEWLRANFPAFRPAVPAKFLRAAGPDQILEAEIQHQSEMVAVAEGLARRHPVDLLGINLMLPDHANHKMPGMEQIAAAYRATDQHLGSLLHAFQPDNIVILSDHGSSRLSGDFLLNAWLRDHGYLVETEARGAARARAINTILIPYLQQHKGWSGVRERAARRALRQALFWMPERIRERAWAPINAAVPFAQDLALLTGKPDYSRTMTFPGSVYSGLLYLNVMGREPAGVIAAQHYEEVLDGLAKELAQITEPGTGKPLFSHLYRPDELFSGPAVAWAPDLILDSFDLGWNIRTSRHRPLAEQVRERYFLDVAGRKDHGWHSRDGIFLFAGPAFTSGPASADGQVMDIPATLLHLHHVPVPDDYDGQVMQFTYNETERARPVTRQPGDDEAEESDLEAYTVEQADEIVGHLRALGYLD